jgi:hypothetical protein
MRRTCQIFWTMAFGLSSLVFVAPKAASQIKQIKNASSGSTESVSVTLPGGVRVQLGFSEPGTYANLSTDQLHQQLAAALLSARPLTQTQKLRVARLAVVLSDREALSNGETYSYVSAMLENRSPGTVHTSVYFDTTTASINRL